MDDIETKQNRINELRVKIYYTETVRDNYKNFHPVLYQTNSYYLERLKKELGELEKSCRDIDDRNQRKFSRVEIQGAVRLISAQSNTTVFLIILASVAPLLKGHSNNQKAISAK